MRIIKVLIVLIHYAYCFTPYRIPIGGRINLGMYWIDMKIGTPPQDVRMHIDTGSNLNIVESSSCPTCPHYNSGYTPDASSSSLAIDCTSDACSKNSCNNRCPDRNACSKQGQCCARLNKTVCAFYVSYGDSSTYDKTIHITNRAEGGLHRDRLSAVSTNTNAVTAVSTVGVSLSQTGNWNEHTDGLLGIAYSNLYCSPSCYKTWIDEIVSEYHDQNIKDVFSICFGEERGIMAIGDIDEGLYKGNISWVDLQYAAYYLLKMIGMAVGTVKLKTGPISCILDSGTTLILLPVSIYNQFKSIMQTHYSNLPFVSTYPSFFDGKAIAIDPTKDWPSLHFTFDGVDVSIPPSVYFLRMEQDGVAYYYLGIQMINDQYVLLGDSFMRGMNTIHDRVNDRIGFSVPSPECFVTGYGIINGFDPYSNDYRNETLPDDTNLIWIQLRLFILKYSVVILIGLLLLFVTCCYCYIQRKRRQNSPHSLSIRTKKKQVPYQKGFEKKNPPLTDPQMVTINPVPVQPVPISFVQKGPVHITPTPPPKPVPFFVCSKQMIVYEYE